MFAIPAIWSMIVGPPDAAAADVGPLIANQGNGHGATACKACHGDAGGGNAALGFPRLAGMSKRYLVLQLDAFARGGRTHPAMSAVAKALLPDEREAVAAYFETARPPAAPGGAPSDQASIARGAELARDGVWSKGLPACSQCHGHDGLGVAPAFPPLAGQSEKYIKGQLDAWRQGKRTGDPLDLMKAVAGKLTDEEVAAAAAYYASLPPTGKDAEP